MSPHVCEMQPIFMERITQDLLAYQLKDIFTNVELPCFLNEPQYKQSALTFEKKVKSEFGSFEHFCLPSKQSHFPSDNHLTD
jgi:hypothetical protein